MQFLQMDHRQKQIFSSAHSFHMLQFPHMNKVQMHVFSNTFKFCEGCKNKQNPTACSDNHIDKVATSENFNIETAGGGWVLHLWVINKSAEDSGLSCPPFALPILYYTTLYNALYYTTLGLPILNFTTLYNAMTSFLEDSVLFLQFTFQC